jgi:hypothetical protein
MTGDYKTPAASAFNVASSPYWGVEGGYQSALDPWKLADNRQFMQNYYQLTTQYAQRGGVEYPVSINVPAHTCLCCVHRFLLLLHSLCQPWVVLYVCRAFWGSAVADLMYA